MPIDPREVVRVMSEGLSAVCASCKLFWEARDQELPGFTCLAKDKCGSPIVGDDFHEYDGYLKHTLYNFCFVCGNKSDFGIRIPLKKSTIGVCRGHLTLLKNSQAVGMEGVTINIEVKGDGSGGSKVKEKKTLGEIIKEVEGS